MNRNKASDRALDRAIHRTWTRMYWAHQVSRGLRRSLLLLGISTAAFLPLTGQSPSTTPAGQSTINIGVPQEPHAAPQVFYFPDITVDVPPESFIVNPPNVELVLNEAQLISMPPISKQWHRARFDKQGDTFWAIPSLDLELKYTRPSTRCTRDTCDADLTFVGEGFNLDRAVLEVNKRRLSLKGPDFCRPVRPDHDYYLECLVYKQEAEPNEKSDLCLHIRRSDFLERKQFETVALDVRWDYMADVIDDYDPQNRQPTIDKFRKSPMEEGDPDGWYPQFCKFKSLVVFDN